MAKNQVFDFGKLKTLSGKTDTPTTPASGSPILFGQIPGVCLVSEDANGYSVMAINGVWDLKVYGLNGSGAVAVNNGDKLYINSSTQVISKVATDIFFGYVVDPTTTHGSQVIASGAVGTVRVLLAL
jgi:predicted RecA/RadA family phage recombinase